MDYTDQSQGRQEENVIQPTGFGAYSSTCLKWGGGDVPAVWQ